MSTPTASPHFDLNNMLKLQQDYAVNLTKIPIDPATNTGNNNAINNLNSKLNSLYNNISNSQAASQAVIFKQQIINDILDTETNRLKDKKGNIDTAIQGQKRMISLNNNYQKRYAAYTRIAIAVVVGVLAYIFISKLMPLLPMIPQFVFYLAIIVVWGLILIFIYVTYADILRRDTMNFDEYSIPRPDKIPSESPAATGAGGQSGSSASGTGAGGSSTPGSYSGCIGQNCCGVDQNGDPIPYSETTGCSIQSAVF